MERQHNASQPQAEGLHLVGQGDPALPSREQLREPESWDERVIREGIEAALAEGRNIDDRTARYIAGQLHGGQASALYALTSSGAVLEGVHDELTQDFEAQQDEVRNWINWLGTYCLDRADTGPVAGWAAHSAELDRQDEARLRREAERERLDELFAEQPDEQLGSTDELGWFGLVSHDGRPGGMVLAQDAQGFREIWETDSDEELAERWAAVEAEHEADETDSYPWGDAMSWYPEAEPAEEPENGRLLPGGISRQGQPTTPEEQVILDRLAGTWAEEQFGSVDELAWFGRFKHEDGQPGGVIVCRDRHGRSHPWETDSDDELAARWQQVLRGYALFQGEHEADDTEGSDQGGAEEQHRGSLSREDDDDHSERGVEPGPEIWVGSLADYNDGRLHGVWLDATLEPEELQEAVQFMLRNGDAVGAEEWAILDHSGFCGLQVSEYESLETVSRLANSVAEHGEPFAHWAEYLGTDDLDYLERTYESAYLGTWESMEAYVEQYLDDSEAYAFLEHVPEGLRQYVKLDVAMMANEMAMDLHVVEAAQGGVMVFETRV